MEAQMSIRYVLVLVGLLAVAACRGPLGPGTYCYFDDDKYVQDPGSQGRVCVQS